MSNDEILEANKLIAEFMEVKFSETDFTDDETFGGNADAVRYHRDWGWLMPVVEKISQTIIKGHEPFNSDQYVRVEIVPNGYVQISNIRDTPIFSNVSSAGSLITAIWLAVVRFIIWYNTQNNKGDV